MKSATQAELKLDRFRSVLQVTGSASCIADVRKQLETVSGPCLIVSEAVWAELMRTRTNDDSSRAAVAKIQEESGCRIHIERSAKQVRLFGRKDQIVVGQELLAKLDGMCVEEVVDMKCAQYLDLEMLRTFAHEFGVTLQVEEARIIVCGVKGAVMEAATELHDHGSDQQNFKLSYEDTKPADAALSAIELAMSQLQSDATGPEDKTQDAMSSGTSTKDTLTPLAEAACPTQASEKQKHGTVLTKTSPSVQQKEEGAGPGGQFNACPTCGDCGKFCTQCGQPSLKLQQKSPPRGACQTCGAANFCIYCGAPTQKNKNNNAAAQQHVSSESTHQDCNVHQGGAYNASSFMPMPGMMAMPMPGMMAVPMPGMMNMMAMNA